MNKKILFAIIVLILIVIVVFSYRSFKLQKDDYGCLANQGYSWCDFKQECVKSSEDGCILTNDWILEKAKKIIGLDLNIIPEKAVELNTQDGETAFSSKGIYYSDLLKAEKAIKGFDEWDKFLIGIGFYNDSYNPPLRNNEEDQIKYRSGNLACVLSRTDNSNDTSSLSLFCGDVANVLYSFASPYGRDCATDFDCNLIVDGCAKRQVCRAKGAKFYNACEDPSSLVSELDTRIADCTCVENQCVPENEKLRENN